MLEITNTSVMNLENAMRGARNPLNSWARSDSAYDADRNYILGENDIGLGMRLCRAGSDHRKFIRQIIVSADITAPLYWWKEFDTYKVGTVANSTSTMHKIQAKEFSREDFSHDHMSETALACLDSVIACLEERRLRFLETKDKAFWYDMIQLLPASYNQLRTVHEIYRGPQHGAFHELREDRYPLVRYAVAAHELEGLGFGKPQL